MDRVLMLRLVSEGCSAEAWINDIPVLRTAAGGGAASLPVHEYLFEGHNRLCLRVAPGVPGQPAALRLARQPLAAGLRLLLPRLGHVGSEASARTLYALDWAMAEGDVFDAPADTRGEVNLPIRFPRWRWPELPAVTDPAAVAPLVGRFVQSLAVALAKGDAEPFLQAAQLRFSELALAYQQDPLDLAARWRSRIQLLRATKALAVVLPAVPDVLLQPCADGRLLQAVAANGEPILRTEPAADGSRQLWPLRIAVANGQCHVVR